MTSWLMTAPVVLPLTAAVASYLAGRRAVRAVLGLYSALLLVAVSALAQEVWQGGTLRCQIGGWGAPVGVELRADGLSILMLALTTAVFLAASAFAVGYFRQGHEDEQDRGFWPLWYVLAGGLNGLFLSADVFNLYVTLELVGLSGVGLVSLAGRPALGAALRYLMVSLVASLAYLLGIALLYAQYGTLDMSTLGRVMTPGPATWTAAAFIIAALMAKSALVPLHVWLPPAHSSAPAPVSAVLSALVIKASFYLLVRMWFEVFPALATPAFSLVLGAAGSIAIVWGSLLAFRQQRLKLVVAYSTVAQVGYLFLVFPLAAGAATSSAGLAVVLHMLSHGCAKAAMFLSAGSLMAGYGTDDIGAMRGAASRMPRSALAFAAGGLVLTGLPPGGNFLSKWLYIESAILSGQWWWVIVIGAGTLLAGAYLFRVLRLFLDSSADARPAQDAGSWMTWPAVALAVLALVLGLLAPWLAGLMNQAPPAGMPALGGIL